MKFEDDVLDFKKVCVDELGDCIVCYVDEEGGLWVYKSVFIFVYVDYEVMIDVSGL